jgi:ATP-dependent protease ClpP protease subunit
MVHSPSASQLSDPDDDTPRQPFQGLIRYERQIPLRQVSYYLCGEIQAAQYYTDLFYTLRSALETDTIFLHLNTPGGDFDCGLQIINNMLASSAHIVTVLEARAYSMGALIFLAGDELVVHDNCQLMFHIYSGSFAGRGNEQQAQVLALSSWFEKVMTNICAEFLQGEEISMILKGADVWMDSDEIRKRLDVASKSRKAKRNARK